MHHSERTKWLRVAKEYNQVTICKHRTVSDIKNPFAIPLLMVDADIYTAFGASQIYSSFSLSSSMDAVPKQHGEVFVLKQKKTKETKHKL